MGRGRRFLRTTGLVVLALATCAGIKRLVQPTIAGPVVDDATRARAQALHERAVVVDGHNDVPMWMLEFDFDLAMNGNEPDDVWPFPYLLDLVDRPGGDEIQTHTDLDRMASGGLDAQFFSVWVGPDRPDPSQPGEAFAKAIRIIDAIDAQIARHPDRLELATTAADVRRIEGAGKVAALLGVEGGHVIEGDLDKLRTLFDRGARYMTLTWSFATRWAGSSGDADDEDAWHRGGLTPFGREVVAEMNRLGMMVDISHVSDETFWDVMEVSRAPVIASHSSSRAVADHPRNMTDDMLRALAKNDGVAMVNYFTWYVDPAKTTGGKRVSRWLWRVGDAPTPLAVLVDHIDHMVEVAGVDHVGIGSDFDGVPFLPQGLEHVGQLPNLTAELLRRGYSDEDVLKILGGNVLRVMEAVETAAQKNP